MYRPFFEEFSNLLNKNKVEFEILNNTNDIWCRDYMPIQINEDKFIQFTYDPDYLKGKWRKTISESNIITESIGIKTIKTKIKIDGGNVVKSATKAILTDKIFKDNPDYKTKESLIQEIQKLLEVEQIIIIPKQPDDFYGHSDGMLRFVDEDSVLINDYSTESKSFQKAFHTAIEKSNLNALEIPYVTSDERNADGDFTAKGIYINYLQIGDLIVLPFFGIKEDELALKKFSEVFPNHRIETINSNPIALEGGILNCISWNIYRKNKPAVAKEIVETEFKPKKELIEIKQSDLPATNNWERIVNFSLTYDGIKHLEGEQNLIVHSNKIEKEYWDTGTFSDFIDIYELRAALFGYAYQKKFTVFNAPNFKDMQYLNAIIMKLNQLLYQKIWEE